jgi:hypothetical protein
MSEPAEAMMELLPPAGWGDLVRQPYVEAEFKLLRGEMAELRAEFKVLGGKVDGQVRRLAAINAVSVLAASVSTAGLVLAAAHFA